MSTEARKALNAYLNGCKHMFLISPNVQENLVESDRINFGQLREFPFGVMYTHFPIRKGDGSGHSQEF